MFVAAVAVVVVAVIVVMLAVTFRIRWLIVTVDVNVPANLTGIVTATGIL